MPEAARDETPWGYFYVPIETASTMTLVIGTPGRQIVVLDCWFVCSANVNVKFQTSTGLVDLTGYAYCIQNGGVVLPFSAGGWFATAPGDSLIINLAGGVPIGGSLTYTLV